MGGRNLGLVSKQVVEGSLLEQIELQKAQYFHEPPASAAEELHMRHQQVHAHGDPQLVSTALRDVPTKLFTFRFCLIHLKNSSTCQRAL